MENYNQGTDFMLSTKQYLQELRDFQSQPGFKQKALSVTTSNGKLNMTLYGPPIFLSKMPYLIETVAKAPYNAIMFAAIAKAKKPLSVIHTEDQKLLGAAAIREELPWYQLLSVKKILELMLQFNTQGFYKAIPFEYRHKDKIIRVKKFDDVKYTLTHEFFHLWHQIDANYDTQNW